MPGHRTRRPLLAVVGATAAMLLAACGSQLDPEAVAGGDGVSYVAGDPSATQAAALGGSGLPTGGATAPSGAGNPTVPGSTSSVPVGTVPTGGPSGGSTAPAGGPTSAATGGQPTSGAASQGPGGQPTDQPDGGPSDAPSSQAPAGDGKQGSCDGFQNQTGITDSTISLANVSDISGPVPGLFQSAQQGAQAFVAYFNATQTLCGRTLKLDNIDTRTDAAGDQQGYTQACDNDFAAIGSVSSQDQGGASTAQGCGIPDLRAFSVTPDTQKCTTCFSTYAIRSNHVASTTASFWKTKSPDAAQHIAILYVDVPASKVNSESFAAAYNKAGLHVDLVQGIPQSEFNYAPYVQQLKDKGIQFVQYFGPYQFAVKLQQSMKQQGFTPAVYLEDPTIYDANYLNQAQGAGEGSYVYSPIQLLDNYKIPEIALYRQWLDQVAPGAIPNYYGLFAWSAARLFVEQATQLGGKLTRASLVDAVKKVKNWTDNGAHAPMAVGAKDTSPCIKFFQLHGSTWSQVSPGDFMCGSLIDTGVGG